MCKDIVLYYNINSKKITNKMEKVFRFSGE